MDLFFEERRKTMNPLRLCVYCNKIITYDVATNAVCTSCINSLTKKYLENNTGKTVKPTLPRFVSPEEVDKMRNEVLKMDFRSPKTTRRIKTAQEEDDLIKNLVGMDDDLTDSDETIEKSLNKIRKENAIALDEVAERNKPAYLRRYEYDRKQEALEYDREQKVLTREEINKQLDDALKSLPTPEEELALVKKQTSSIKIGQYPGHCFYTILY